METIKFGEDCEYFEKTLRKEEREYLERALRKQMRILEGQPEKFTASELINLYTIIYNMCYHLDPRYDSIVDVYDIYKRFCDEYIDSSVLPSLREEHDDDELVLHEIAKTWTNYKLMVRWLIKVFNYLERWLQSWRSIGTLKVVGYRRFEKRVCAQIGDKVKDTVVALVTRERQGEQIDRTLMKNLIQVYAEIDTETKSTIVEYKDFENYIEDSVLDYWRKALVWLMEKPFPNYMVEVEKALTEEKERVSRYRVLLEGVSLYLFSENLNASSEAKLLERVKKEMLVVVPGTKLFDNECRALLRQDRKDDLARMFRLYRDVPQALEHVAALFKQHVANEGIALVQLAAGEEPGLDYVEKLYALHAQYKGYVVHCWENHELFQNALKEAFVLSAELLATFCDKKIGELTIDD